MDSEKLHDIKNGADDDDDDKKHAVHDKCSVKRDNFSETNDGMLGGGCSGNGGKNITFKDYFQLYHKGLHDDNIKLDKQESSRNSHHDKPDKFISDNILPLIAEYSDKKERDTDNKIIGKISMGGRVKDRVRSKSCPDDTTQPDNKVKVKRSISLFSERPKEFRKMLLGDEYPTPMAQVSFAKDRTLDAEPDNLEGENSVFSEKVCKGFKKFC